MRALTDLDEHVLASIQKDKTLLSDVSKANYVTKLRHLITVSNMSLLKFISKSRRALKFIKKKWKNQKTRQSYVAAITSALRRCRRLSSKVPISSITMFRLAAKELNDRIKQSYSKQIASPKQLDAFVPWTEVVAKRDSLESGSFEKLFLSCYSLDIVPLRNDWHRVLLITNRIACPKPRAVIEKNYLFLPRGIEESGVLVLGECKVSRHLTEPYRIQVSPALCNEIRTSLQVSPREWMFVSSSGEPYTAKNFSGWSSRCLKRLFPNTKGASICMLRHSFLCHVGIDKMSSEQRQELAKLMCHSTETQHDYIFTNASDSNAFKNKGIITIEKLDSVPTNIPAKRKPQNVRTVNIITL